jgi:hypothetical protein
MKKTTLIFILFTTLAHWAYSQCTTQGYQWPTGTVTIANAPGAQTISNNNWPDNEFSVITGLVVGETYNVATDLTTYITVTEGDGTTVITHGFDSVTFTATTTDIICFWTIDAACNGQSNRDTITTIECTTCTCTEVQAPGAPTNPTPADGAVDVAITGTVITPFSWDEGLFGGTAESFNLSLGLTVTGDDIGTISGATNGNGINYAGWAYNTTYYWKVEAVNCFGSTTSAVWSFTTTACTATAAPDAVTTPTPADGAIDVPIDISGSPDLLITPFSWVEAATGDPADAFNINLGTDTAGTNIGTVSGATSGNGITYPSWAYNTTYYWSVEAVNCFGGTTSSVWSFTTEDDPALSVEENEISLFNVYPNPVKSMAKIDTDLQIDSISIINHLGQSIITIDKNRIINNELDVSSLSAGLYFLNITSGDKTGLIKMIKE